MEYSRGTAFLNLLPDFRLRQACHASAFIKAPAPRGVGDGRVQSPHRSTKRSARRPVSRVSSLSGTKGHHMASMNGTIKRLVSDKGFGFILAGDGSEYFFHNSACQQTAFDDLREGQAVTFDMGQGPKGPRGENVRLS
jgi:CspA family cold shock protein